MDNDRFFDTLGLIDLISEKHKQLRLRTMKRIERDLGCVFSEMDIYLISLAQFNTMSVSESARYMNISRQAAHKHVKHLVDLDFIQLTTSEFNRREKSITLTTSGKQLSQQLNDIKNELEIALKETLGAESYQKIRSLFKSDW